jgi:hypothetical protein
MKTKSFLLIVSFSLAFINICGQEVPPEPHAFPTSGGVATSATGSVSYTVGQVFYSYSAGENGSITEGVQQAFEIEVDTATDNTNDIFLSCSLYPNPVSEHLILNIDSGKRKDIVYRLYSINGKLLETKPLCEKETKIQFGDYPSSTYYLQLFEGSSFLKSFKIVKN